MSYQNLRKKTEGFTIIEVLIVLAIAGLIMLIVFLAVPALQRNNRNTQYKNAAAAVLAAVNEYSNNNNGATPTSVDIAANGEISVDSQVTGKTQGGYEANVAGEAPDDGTTGTFSVALNKKCEGNTLAAGTQKRAVAVLYNVEISGGDTNPQCTES